METTGIVGNPTVTRQMGAAEMQGKSMTEQQKAPQEQGVDSVALKIEVDTESFLNDIREGVRQIAREAAREEVEQVFNSLSAAIQAETVNRMSLESLLRSVGLLRVLPEMAPPIAVAYGYDPATGVATQEKPAEQGAVIRIDANQAVEELLEQIAEFGLVLSKDRLLALLDHVLEASDFVPAVTADNKLALTVNVVSIVGKLRAALAA